MHALGIIGLMSFLVGIVIAQQGAVQLRQFGAEVYTINLIGRSRCKELGVLMTAIMVAGRSGSAFAAQLGSMKLTEEVDAMRTIGVSPMEALVFPRVLATVLLMPLLGFYAAIMAIIGGGIFCWISLDIPPVTFIQRIREVVPMTDLWQALIKAPVFGLIIAMAGCFQGMQVEGQCRGGRPPDHHRGRPGHLPGHRARRLLRRLLHRDRLALMADARHRHRGPRPAEQLRRAGRPRGPRPRRAARRDFRRGRRLGHRQVGADALDHRPADARRGRDRGVRRVDDRPRRGGGASMSAAAGACCSRAARCSRR